MSRWKDVLKGSKPDSCRWRLYHSPWGTSESQMQ